MPPSANERGIEAMERIESLSSKLLGRRWGLSHRTLERWRHDGTGPAFLKIGGRVVYRLEDVQAFESTLVRQPVKPGFAPAPSRGPR
jgi:hypothetical protein